MIWNRLAIFATVFRPGTPRSVERDCIQRWHKAVAAQPALAEDLIRLGGVLTLSPPRDGPPSVEQLAYEAGRRDFALQLLSVAGLSPYQLNQMMDDPDA
jgi:hypothetical protein